MKKTKFYNITIVFSLVISLASYGQEKTITLSTDHSGATHDKVARDAVILDEGFIFDATGGSYTFTARTDESLICGVDYLTGTAIPDPMDRDLNTSYEVGSIAGRFNVTADGAASYTIPIFVSPGTAGMQPSLAVNYNSNGGQGLLGKGWALSGLSAIYRAPSDFYHDGQVDPIDYDSYDAFMMDGMRLIKDGSVYKTELENYSTITPTYSGSAITKFTVQTKNGKTIEYGGSTEAKQSNVDDTRYFAWYITKVQDAFGNYMTYTYENDESNGLRLTKIDYTGNAPANLDAYNTVYFFYEERQDSTTSYVYGKPVKHNLILRKIRAEAEGMTSRSYEFKYISDSDVSLLAEVIEYGSDNSRFNSTVFDYHDYQDSWVTVGTGLTDNFSEELYGDINGDGRTDLILKSGSYVKYYTTNNEGSGITYINQIYVGSSDYEVGDFNGDGMDDIIVFSSSSIKWYKSTGSGFTYTSSSDISLSGIEDVHVYDVNGDNIIDAVVQRSSSIYVYVGDETDPFNSSYYSATFDWGEESYFYDFIGDGKYELVINDGSAFHCYNADNNIFYEFHNGSVPGTLGLVFGDFNGDGKMDFLHGQNVLGEFKYVKINIADGNTFVTSDFEPTLDVESGSMIAYDEDGNGKYELFAIRPGIPPIGEDYYSCNIYRYDGNDFVSDGIGGANFNVKEMDFNGDGIKDGIYNASADDKFYFQYFRVGNTKHRLHTIADGLNNKTIIDYGTIADTAVHTPYLTGGSYPFNNFNGPLYVVQHVKQNDGIGGYFETSYKYAGAKMFKSDLRFLGFSKMEAISSETQFTTRNNQVFHLTYPYASSKTRTVIDNNNNNASTAKTENTISHIANKRIKVYPQYSSSWDYLNGVNDSTVYTFDPNGNIAHKKTYIGNSGTSDTYYESYTTVAGSPVPNVPQTVRAVGQRGSKPSFERRVSINYNTSNGFVNYKIIDPDEGKPLRVDYTPVTNGLGLVWKEKASGSDFTDRETEYIWGSKGRFVTKAYSPEDQVTENTYDPLTGNLLTSELPTGFIDENTYDGFGRLTFNKASGQSMSLGWYSAGQITGCLYYAHITGDAAPEQYVYYDTLGRGLSAETQAYETSKTIVTNKSYNEKGQLEWASTPFFDGETEYKTIFTYDDFGRVTEENYANGTNQVNYTYSAKQVVTTNSAVSPSQSVTKKFDEYGNVSKVIDDSNNELKYSYNSTGNVDTVYTPDGEVVTLYDEYGRPSQVKDPDLGTTSYTYYVTGELKTETKNSNTTTYTYNKNGQVKSIAVPEGTTTYYYSGTTGLLSSIDGLNNNDVSFSYDGIGRLSGKTETIDGQNYVFSYTYTDEHTNRLDTMTYPGNFSLKYGYSNGYLDEIRRGSDNSLIWLLEETSPLGQVEKYTNGNNLVTTKTYDYKTSAINRIQTGSIQDLIYDYDDATGNLTSREDNKHSLTETFGYDDLNRLTSITFNSNTINIGLDDNGNIDSKGDLGTYEYNATQPHAVSKITPSVTYAPETQTAIYTSFDKLYTLTQGSNNLTITYGYDFNRRKTVYTDGSTTKTKIFVPGGYEKINRSTPDDEEYCYISTPAGITAVYDKTNNEMFYIHPDNLGSVHFITDESGTVEQELSFDAWGRQRNASNWTYNSLPSPKFERGYTFHEHLSEFDLINMNGRMYDPVVAKFLSPDPVLQMPGNLQNYNRYSYVLNNPLKYTDPSGYKYYTADRPFDFFDDYPDRMHSGATGGSSFAKVGGFVADVGPTYEDLFTYYYNETAGTGAWISNDEVYYSANEGVAQSAMQFLEAGYVISFAGKIYGENVIGFIDPGNYNEGWNAALVGNGSYSATIFGSAQSGGDALANGTDNFLNLHTVVSETSSKNTIRAPFWTVYQKNAAGYSKGSGPIKIKNGVIVKESKIKRGPLTITTTESGFMLSTGNGLSLGVTDGFFTTSYKSTSNAYSGDWGSSYVSVTQQYQINPADYAIAIAVYYFPQLITRLGTSTVLVPVPAY